LLCYWQRGGGGGTIDNPTSMEDDNTDVTP
jgi:hypothetical protein